MIDGVAERTKASVATLTDAGSKPRRGRHFSSGLTVSGDKCKQTNTLFTCLNLQYPHSSKPSNGLRCSGLINNNNKKNNN